MINGTVVNWDNQNRAEFGILQNKSTIIGYVSNSSDYQFKTLISGIGWLVRNGESYVKHSREFAPSGNTSFVRIKAPRTAVGVMEDGSIMLAVVDGV